MEVLQLGVIALKLDAFEAKLVTFGAARDRLGGTTLGEVTLAQCCQCDVEARGQHSVNVLTVDAVNRLPFDVDETRVAHNHVVICQLQIYRHLLREVPCH